MSIKTTSKNTSTTAVAEGAVKAQEENINLELSRISRYFFKGTLYEKGSVYVFDKATAMKVLSITDPAGMQVFCLAKPRTRMVAMPVPVQKVSFREVAPPEVIIPVAMEIAPKGTLDLGEGDAEMEERFANVDSSEFDSGDSVTI